MKHRILALCLLLSGAVISSDAFAATPLNVVFKKVNNFQFIRAHRQGSAIALSWSADGAVSFRIERSYDGEFFDAIATVSAAERTNRYQDAGVYPGTIYYKVVAIFADGSTSESPVAVARIVSRG